MKHGIGKFRNNMLHVEKSRMTLGKKKNQICEATFISYVMAHWLIKLHHSWGDMSDEKFVTFPKCKNT